MQNDPMGTDCKCRQPGLGGDCDGSCTHPPPQSDDIKRWARALGNIPADIREGKNHDAGKCLAILAVSLLNQRDEIARLKDVIRTVVVNLERGEPAGVLVVAAWAKEQINAG